MTLSEETGEVPPLSHTWKVTLVENMLHYARTGLTKAVVMGQVGQSFFMGMLFGRTPESR